MTVDVPLLLGLFFELAVVTAATGVVALFAFARLTGWYRLAKQFPAVTEHVPALRYRSRGVIIGPFSRSAPPLRVVLGPDRLTLVPAFPFSIAFGRVSIPWSDVLSTAPRRYALFEVLELRYARGESATIGFLASDAARAIAARCADTK